MDKTQKDVLRKNTKFLIDNLVNMTDICDALFEKGIITNGMKDEILNKKPVPHGQVRHLITTILPKRGTKAFVAFIDSLRETENGEYADKLAIEAGLQEPSEQPNEPQKDIKPEDEEQSEPDWTLETEIVKEIKTCQPNDPKLAKQGNTIYCMTKEQFRGKVLMLKNYKCKQNDDSENTKKTKLPHDLQQKIDRDCLNLDQALKLAKFKVNQKLNRTTDQTMKILEPFKEPNGFKGFDCFFLILISVGENPHNYYGTSENAVTPQAIIDFLRECEALKGKPKIVLNQCYCQDDWNDQCKGSGDTVDATRDLGSRTNNDDIFLVCSTPEKGQPVWMEGKDLLGSWFIQAFVHVFKNHAHELSFMEMIDKVDRLLGNTAVAGEDGKVTKKRVANVEVFTKCENKDLYFFPMPEESFNNQQEAAGYVCTEEHDSNKKPDYPIPASS